MAHRFEDGLAWQKARLLNKAICELSLGRAFSRYFGLKDRFNVPLYLASIVFNFPALHFLLGHYASLIVLV